MIDKEIPTHEEIISSFDGDLKRSAKVSMLFSFIEGNFSKRNLEAVNKLFEELPVTSDVTISISALRCASRAQAYLSAWSTYRDRVKETCDLLSPEARNNRSTEHMMRGLLEN